MNIKDLVAKARHQGGWTVLDVADLPALPDGLHLPDDVSEFYKNCGGIRLAVGQDEFHVVSPTDFVRSNDAILGETHANDRSHWWFVIGRSGEQYVSIDLAPGRLGRCYDSFWDRHAVAGSCPVIAASFSEFLARLLDGDGSLYWLAEDFVAEEDAYDD